jgi:hypothetical protein
MSSNVLNPVSWHAFELSHLFHGVLEMPFLGRRDAALISSPLHESFPLSMEVLIIVMTSGIIYFICWRFIRFIRGGFLLRRSNYYI